MKSITVKRAAELCGARLCGEYTDREINNVIIDSRLVSEGDMFVAYCGEKVDGHDYIAAALKKGAACCLAERVPEEAEGAVLAVDDVQEALERIAAGYRDTLTLPVIGITGSVGKTSAKEMIWAVLSTRFNTLKTDGNLNNQIGVPMTLSRIEPQHEAAVIEMGISGFGEMRRLAKMVRPDIAVFTVIGHAHLEFLHDLDGVFRAKTEMLEEMKDDAVIIINGDDGKLRQLKDRRGAISIGLGEECDIRAENIVMTPDGCTECRIVYKERRLDVNIPAYGQHMVYAALEGAAVGFVMGLSDEEICRGIGSYEVVGRRGAVSDTGYLTLIDDCYNANPDSMHCAINSLSRMSGRHVCVLADMLEMGSETHEMHREVGKYAVKNGAELVICTGELGREIAEGAGDRAAYFETREELINALPSLLKKGDTVLVKASNGMKLGTVADAIKKIGEI